MRRRCYRSGLFVTVVCRFLNEVYFIVMWLSLFLVVVVEVFHEGGGRIICWRHVSIAAFPLERIEMFRLIMISIMGGRRLGWSGPVLNTAFCKSMELHCKLLVVESENVERGWKGKGGMERAPMTFDDFLGWSSFVCSNGRHMYETNDPVSSGFLKPYSD